MPRDDLGEMIAELWSRGASVQAIAGELGVSRRAVDKHIGGLDLPPRGETEAERKRWTVVHTRAIERSNTIAHLIDCAAKKGVPAPTNPDIGRALGLGDYANHAVLAKWLRLAVERGLIVIERHPDSPKHRRRFQHVASGRWTDWTDMRRSAAPKIDRDALVPELPGRPLELGEPLPLSEIKTPTIEEADRWINAARPGDRLPYFVGPHLPRAPEAVARIAAWVANQYSAGRVVPVQRRVIGEDGRPALEYLVVRAK